jgi:mannose/fructose/N-acetylgalactosamine-specific phosphotransferase system component IID
MMGALVRSWFRLFLVQACWNYDRMIGTGMAHALDPLLARLPGGRAGERYRAAMRRAVAYFNAHPYFTGLAVGAEARAEHEEQSGEHIERLRRALVGPLGSLGDQIVWAGALPAAIGVGLVTAVQASALAGVLGFLVLYNVLHLFTRSWALAAGWRLGKDVAGAIRGAAVRRVLAVAAPAAALSVGVALPLSAEWLMRAFDVEARLAVAGIAAAAIVLARWVVPALGGVRFGLIVAVLAAGAGWL